ncbi:hypothetical protein D6745_05060 [Candidatus Woesearchaeota archaeon]|nr:MAG: hypothetical protein D6745_05060 [Candidatus Woesearchaeota archaeon]
MKKGFMLYESWPELFFWVLLIIGFFLSLAIQNVFFSYLVIFICGMMVGFIMVQRKGKLNVPVVIIIIGFLLGYILGNFYTSKKALIIVFALGWALSHYLYVKGYIKRFIGFTP